MLQNYKIIMNYELLIINYFVSLQTNNGISDYTYR
jgi:hypothetical protein